MYYPRVLKNFLYNLLLLYQIYLARILQYASTLVMAPLPCTNSQLYILPNNIFDNFINDMTSENANYKVRFPNWLFHLSKLFLHHRYDPLKTNMHPKVLRMLLFSLFLYK